VKKARLKSVWLEDSHDDVLGREMKFIDLYFYKDTLFRIGFVVSHLEDFKISMDSIASEYNTPCLPCDKKNPLMFSNKATATKTKEYLMMTTTISLATKNQNHIKKMTEYLSVATKLQRFLWAIVQISYPSIMGGY
jgi:hypothetical protein